MSEASRVVRYTDMSSKRRVFIAFLIYKLITLAILTSAYFCFLTKKIYKGVSPPL